MTGATWSEQRLEGYLAPDQAQQYHNVPFQMPDHVRRLEVRYEYSHPIGCDPHLTGGNTLDIGLFDQRGAGYPGRGFRGWTGSARSEFFIGHDDATPGYLAGPLDPGEWNVSLGFYKSAPEGCHYTITLRFLRGDGHAPASLPPLLTLANSRSTLPLARRVLSRRAALPFLPQRATRPARLTRRQGWGWTSWRSPITTRSGPRPRRRSIRHLVLIPAARSPRTKGTGTSGAGRVIDFRTLTPDLMRELDPARGGAGLPRLVQPPRTMGPPWEFKAITGQHCIEVWNGPWRSSTASRWPARSRLRRRAVGRGGRQRRALPQAPAHRADRHADDVDPLLRPADGRRAAGRAARRTRLHQRRAGRPAGLPVGRRRHDGRLRAAPGLGVAGHDRPRGAWRWVAPGVPRRGGAVGHK